MPFNKTASCFGIHTMVERTARSAGRVPTKWPPPGTASPRSSPAMTASSTQSRPLSRLPYPPESGRGWVAAQHPAATCCGIATMGAAMAASGGRSARGRKWAPGGGVSSICSPAATASSTQSRPLSRLPYPPESGRGWVAAQHPAATCCGIATMGAAMAASGGRSARGRKWAPGGGVSSICSPAATASSTASRTMATCCGTATWGERTAASDGKGPRP